MDNRGQCQRGTNAILALLGVGSTDPSRALETFEEQHDARESNGFESHGGMFGARNASVSIKRARVDPYQHGHPQEPLGGGRQNPLFTNEDRQNPLFANEDRGFSQPENDESAGYTTGFQHGQLLEDDLSKAVSGYGGGGSAKHGERMEAEFGADLDDEPRQQGNGRNRFSLGLVAAALRIASRLFVSHFVSSHCILTLRIGPSLLLTRKLEGSAGSGGFFALKRARDEEVNWKPLGSGGGRFTNFIRPASQVMLDLAVA